MKKHMTINFDKSMNATFSAIRTVVLRLGTEIKHTDKNEGVLDFKTKSRLIFFGRKEFAVRCVKIDNTNTMVTISSRESGFEEMAKNFFREMDKEIPVRM